MDKINEHIDDRLIISDLDAETKEEALDILVRRVFEVKPGLFGEGFTEADLRREVISRENIQTTGLGNGIAFPHARVANFSDFALAIGIKREGIDWKSLDGKACQVICLMISPQVKPYLILQMMAMLVRYTGRPENIKKLTSGLTSEEIGELIRKSAVSTSKTVLARDIMHPVKQTVGLEDSVEATTRLMHLNRVDILPVTDEAGALVGEISCLDIFGYGIPDFFNQLQTISFMRNLDPFEKYFKYEKDLKVKDIYSPTANVIARDATLMEIIFEMTARKKLRLFVVDSGKLIGAVDRFSVIDKILFF